MSSPCTTLFYRQLWSNFLWFCSFQEKKRGRFYFLKFNSMEIKTPDIITSLPNSTSLISIESRFAVCAQQRNSGHPSPCPIPDAPDGRATRHRRSRPQTLDD